MHTLEIYLFYLIIGIRTASILWWLLVKELFMRVTIFCVYSVYLNVTGSRTKPNYLTTVLLVYSSSQFVY